MTLNLVAWNTDYVAVCSDRRVCLLSGRDTRLRNDDETKIVSIAPYCGGRYIVTFNGLAGTYDMPMDRWLASRLLEIDAIAQCPRDLCQALADAASETRVFSTVNFVHTFVFAGWNALGQPLVGVVHNGAGTFGDGVRVDRFRLDPAPVATRPAGALVSGQHSAVSESNMQHLAEMMDSSASMDAAHQYLGYLVREASRRNCFVSSTATTVFIGRNPSLPIQIRSHEGGSMRTLDIPIHVQAGQLADFHLEFDTAISLLSKNQKKAFRRVRRGKA